MEVDFDILKQYNDINGFKSKQSIDKDLLYNFIGRLFYNKCHPNNINDIIKDLEEQPFTCVGIFDDFNSALDRLNELYDPCLIREDYQILSDAFDYELPYFITIDKNNKFCLYQNRLRVSFNKYKNGNIKPMSLHNMQNVLNSNY